MLTVSEVKTSWIKIDALNTDLDTQIEGWIATATSMIEKICKQPILQKEVSFKFIGNGRQVRLLHVTVPFDITAAGSRPRPIDAWNMQPTLDVVTFDIEGVMYAYREGTFDSIEWILTGDAGWVIADVPLAIKQVCGEMVYTLFRESPYANDQRILGVSSVSKAQGGINTTVSFMDMMPRWEHRLEPWTIVTC